MTTMILLALLSSTSLPTKKDSKYKIINGQKIRVLYIC